MKFLILFLFSIQTYGFTLNSSTNPNFKGWSNKEINFVINSNNCPAQADISGLMNSAFEVWNKAPTSNVQLKVVGTVNTTGVSNPVTVYCETNFNAVTGASENFVPAVAGLSAQGDYAAGGIMVLNVSAGQANIANFDRNLLKIILAHEVGHIIGLGHSEDSQALMYYNASAKKTLNLSQDDLDGLSYLYPRDELSGDQLLGCGLVKNWQPPQNPHSYFLIVSLLMMIPLLLALIERKRIFRRNSFSLRVLF